MHGCMPAACVDGANPTEASEAATMSRTIARRWIGFMRNGKLVPCQFRRLR